MGTSQLSGVVYYFNRIAPGKSNRPSPFSKRWVQCAIGYSESGLKVHTDHCQWDDKEWFMTFQSYTCDKAAGEVYSKSPGLNEYGPGHNKDTFLPVLWRLQHSEIYCQDFIWPWCKEVTHETVGNRLGVLSDITLLTLLAPCPHLWGYCRPMTPLLYQFCSVVCSLLYVLGLNAIDGFVSTFPYARWLFPHIHLDKRPDDGEFNQFPQCGPIWAKVQGAAKCKKVGHQHLDRVSASKSPGPS